MSLQLQFCTGASQNTEVADVNNAHHRMSRIVTKLFGRVLKAQGNEKEAFSSNGFDLEQVLYSMDNVLSKSQPHGTAYTITSDTSDLTDLDSMAADKMTPCRSMCNTFMIELLNTKHTHNKVIEVKVALQKIGYIRETIVGRLFISC